MSPAGCSKAEPDDSTFGVLDAAAGSGGYEAGSFDVVVDVPVTPSCDDPTDTDGDLIADTLE